MKDSEGFVNREENRFEVRSYRDEAPRVVIDEPKTDRDVPAEATVPVRVVIDDDFGIHSGRMLYKIATGDSEPREGDPIPLFAAIDQSPAPAARSLVKHKEVEHIWELAPFKLAPGSIITFYADARDFDAIKGPNVGKSRELRLRIVSKEDAARQFDDARRELRDELARVLTMQKQAMTPVDNAARTLSRTDRLPQPQRDDLNNASMIQRQVSGRFTSREEGLAARLRRMLDDLRNFKMANPDAQKQLEDMAGRVDNIRDRNLEPAEQGIVHAVKDLDNREPATGDRRPSHASGQPDAGAPGKPESEKAQASEPRGAEKKDATGSQSKGSPSRQTPAGEASKTSRSQHQGQAAEKSSGGRPEAAKEQAQGQPQGGQPESQPGGESKPSKSDPARQALAEAKANQKAIADELQKMLDNLSEFETYRGVVKDAQELLKQQEQTMKQTAEVAARPETTGKMADEMSAEQKSELANIASRQGQVRSGLQKLQERMGEMANRLDQTDPLASAALREAAEKSQKQGTAGKMGEAAEQIEKQPDGLGPHAPGAGPQRGPRPG